jgi:hypothetical protein
LTRVRLGPLLALLAGCAPGSAVPERTVPQPPPLSSACDEARDLRTRAAGLRAAGYLDRARRVLEKAESRCSTPEGRAAIARVADELKPDAFDLLSASSILRDAAAARAGGSEAEARRKLDRILVAVEAEQGESARFVALWPVAGFSQPMVTADSLYAKRTYAVAPDGDRRTAFLQDPTQPAPPLVALTRDDVVSGYAAGKALLGIGKDEVVFDIARARYQVSHDAPAALSLRDDLAVRVDERGVLRATRPVRGGDLADVQLPADLGGVRAIEVVSSRIVAVAGQKDYLLIDLAARKNLARVPYLENGTNLTVRADGTAAAVLYQSGTDGLGIDLGVAIVDLRGARETRLVPKVARTSSAWLPTLVWTPDGATLIVATGPRSAVLVDASRGSAQAISGGKPSQDEEWDSVAAITFAKGGQMVCASPSWERAQGPRRPWLDLRRRVFAHEGATHEFCFQNLAVTLPRTGKEGVTAPDRHIVRSHFGTHGSYDVEALSPDERTLVLLEAGGREGALEDPRVLLIDVPTRRVRRTIALPAATIEGAFLQLDFALGGRRLVASSSDESRIFDVETGNMVVALPWSGGGYVYVSADGRYLWQWGEVVYDVERGGLAELGPARTPHTFEPLRPILEAEGVDAEAALRDKKAGGSNEVLVAPRGKLHMADGGAACCEPNESFTFPLPDALKPNLVARAGTTLAFWVTNKRDPGPLSFVDLESSSMSTAVEDKVIQPDAITFDRSGTRLVALNPGIVQVFAAPGGQRLATVVALSSTLAVALLAEGRIDWLGTAKDPRERSAVQCVIGNRVVPYEVCAGRLLAPGAVESALRGERTYLAP